MHKAMEEIEFENIHNQLQRGHFFFNDLEKELNRLLNSDFVHNVKELKFNCLGYSFELNIESTERVPFHIFKNIDNIYIVSEYRGVDYNYEGVLKMSIRKNGNISILFSDAQLHEVIFTDRFETFKRNVVNVINNG